MDNWIKVSDRLPDILQTVILFSGRVTVGWLEGNGDPLFWSCEFDGYEDNVTYWMALPGPPVEGDFGPYPDKGKK